MNDNDRITERGQLYATIEVCAQGVLTLLKLSRGDLVGGLLRAESLTHLQQR